MNILENYIVDIISVEPYNAEWTKKFDKDFLKIKVKVDCYGHIEERTTVENVDDWKIIKDRGYFLW